MGLILTTTPTLSSQVTAESCYNWTHEQSWLVHAAYAIGKPVDYGHTLAAIVIQESFVDDLVVRANPNDGRFGSYGVTHILLTTAMFMEGEVSSWQAKAKLLPNLINNDVETIKRSLNYIGWIETSFRTNWFDTVAKYNGQGSMAKAYANSIVSIVKNLQDCRVFDYG